MSDRARTEHGDFVAGVAHVLDLMREAGLPYSESRPETIYPYSNGFSTWFISKEQSVAGLSTAPMTAEEIAALAGGFRGR